MENSSCTNEKKKVHPIASVVKKISGWTVVISLIAIVVLSIAIAVNSGDDSRTANSRARSAKEYTYFLQPGKMVSEDESGRKLFASRGQRVHLEQLGESNPAKVWIVDPDKPSVAFPFSSRVYTTGPALKPTSVLALRLDKKEKGARRVKARIVK